MHRLHWSRPVSVALATLVAAGFLILALPPVIRFIAFLMGGDIWRGLLGVALMALLVGLAMLATIGGSRQPHSGRHLSTVAWSLIALAPVCIMVAFVGSGWLVDIIREVGDLVPKIRHLVAGPSHRH